MIRSLALALALATVAAACGGPTTLMLKPNDTVIPVVNGEDPGYALGQCVRFTETGPVTTPCPLGVDRFFDKPRTHEMNKPGAYFQGVFTRGGGVERAYETVLAYELVTYTSHTAPWKTRLKPRDLPALRAVCGDRRNHDALVVVRAFDGCSVVLAGDRRQAWRWTMVDLASEGTTIGQPEGFWSQEPSLDRAPQDASCQTQRVVQVEVLPIGRACARYQADLFPPDPTLAGP